MACYAFWAKHNTPALPKKNGWYFSRLFGLLHGLDDVLVASYTREEHLKHVKAILREFTKHGIVISETKYELCKKEIDFLGVHIKQGHIALHEHIVKKILEFPEPITSRKQLQSYLGILNCASDFIKNLAKYRSSLSS